MVKNIVCANDGCFCAIRFMLYRILFDTKMVCCDDGAYGAYGAWCKVYGVYMALCGIMSLYGMDGSSFGAVNI